VRLVGVAAVGGDAVPVSRLDVGQPAQWRIIDTVHGIIAA
jgi:hypothetical protein